MLHSFGARSAVEHIARTIRTELEQQSPWPLELQEHNLLSARFNNPGSEAPFVDYLRSLYSGRPPDIVMSIGAPAARFVRKYRAELFPKTPMVLTAVEQRTASSPSRRSRIAPTPHRACTPQPVFGCRRTDNLDRA